MLIDTLHDSKNLYTFENNYLINYKTKQKKIYLDYTPEKISIKNEYLITIYKKRIFIHNLKNKSKIELKIILDSDCNCIIFRNNLILSTEFFIYIFDEKFDLEKKFKILNVKQIIDYFDGFICISENKIGIYENGIFLIKNFGFLNCEFTTLAIQMIKNEDEMDYDDLMKSNYEIIENVDENLGGGVEIVEEIVNYNEIMEGGEEIVDTVPEKEKLNDSGNDKHFENLENFERMNLESNSENFVQINKIEILENHESKNKKNNEIVHKNNNESKNKRIVYHFLKNNENLILGSNNGIIYILNSNFNLIKRKKITPNKIDYIFFFRNIYVIYEGFVRKFNSSLEFCKIYGIISTEPKFIFNFGNEVFCSSFILGILPLIDRDEDFYDQILMQ